MHCSAWKVASRPVKPEDQPRIAVYENAHWAASLLLRGVLHAWATVKSSPESVRICRPASTLVPSMRTTTGTRIFTRARRDDAGSQGIAAQDASKNIDQHGADVVIGKQDTEGVLDLVALAPPPTSRKFAGLPPAYLMISMVAMARPAPFTMQPPCHRA